MGLLGNAGLNAPLFVYVSRWFDRRRGSALALISSGGYLAGFIWPTIFERSIAHFGWRWTMIGFAVLQLVDHRAARDHLPAPAAGTASASRRRRRRRRRRPKVFGWNGNVVFAMLSRWRHSCAASPCRCRSSIWSRSAATSAFPTTLGATMLSVLLGMGFFSRQGWGWLSDRMGGLLDRVAAARSCNARR